MTKTNMYFKPNKKKLRPFIHTAKLIDSFRAFFQSSSKTNYNSFITCQIIFYIIDHIAIKRRDTSV